jgi:CRISPR-associated protein Cmr2
MPRYLVTITLGPVQNLIEAARRTRDLWCGSWLLSEAARAAALTLHQAHPGSLIFPCPTSPDVELQPQKEPGDSANIANILRAQVELPDSHAAARLCRSAQDAATLRLRDLGEQVRAKLRVKLREEVWQAQIGELLESFAAWTEIPEGDSSYAQASQQLGATLAARKATRDFPPAPLLHATGLPKSSLDGGLETVLPEWREEHRVRRQLGLARGEQLDALGVMKRLAGNVEQFTPYSRVAADPWIRGLDPKVRQRIAAAYEPLVGGLATRVSGNRGCYADFPYDAQMLYDFRLDNALGMRGEDAPTIEEIADLRTLRKVLQPVYPVAGGPVPYAAILKADGDRMGALLQRATNAEASREISRALHRFASAVRETVRAHHGHAIYSGGDDVLALLPLVDAFACARALAQAFGDALQAVATRLGVATQDRPTLSVGLAIGHLMEPLGALRARAQDAEQLAKANDLPAGSTRNALAIVLGVRSGSALQWRANWHDHQALAELESFTAAYRAGQLPSRVAYDLRAIDQRLAWLRNDTSTTACGMRAAEVARMLERARIDGGSKRLDTQQHETIRYAANRQSLAQLADTLILARWLSARTFADLGVRGQ